MNEYKFADMAIGMSAKFTKRITAEMEDLFRKITGDENPLHWDDGYAASAGNGGFQGHVTFGMLTASLYSTLAGMYLPGKYSLIHSVELGFQKPVYADDVLTVEGTVTGIQPELKLLTVKCRITNQNGQCVSKANMKVLVLQ